MGLNASCHLRLFSLARSILSLKKRGQQSKRINSASPDASSEGKPASGLGLDLLAFSSNTPSAPNCNEQADLLLNVALTFKG
jgi:hypothetical protein